MYLIYYINQPHTFFIKSWSSQFVMWNTDISKYNSVSAYFFLAWCSSVLRLLLFTITFTILWWLYFTLKSNSKIATLIFLIIKQASLVNRFLSVCPKRIPWHIYWFPGTALTKYHRLGGLNNRNLLSHSSWGWVQEQGVGRLRSFWGLWGKELFQASLLGL